MPASRGEIVNDSILSETRSAVPVDHAVHIISTGNFSPTGVQLAESQRVTLIDGAQAAQTFSSLPNLVGNIGLPQERRLERAPTTPQPSPKKSAAKKFINTVLAILLGLALLAGLGFGAMIGLPKLKGLTGNMEDAKARRLAKQMASVYTAAEAAGLDFVDQGNGDMMTTLRLINSGGKVDDSSSVFNGSAFGGENLSEADLQLASRYLEIDDDGSLVYDVSLTDPASAATEFHFVEDYEGIDAELMARRDAVSLARASKRARHEGTDFLQIAGGDRDEALRLLLSRLSTQTAQSHPQYQENFADLAKSHSERLNAAKAFLVVQQDQLIYRAETNALHKVSDLIPR